MAKFPIVEAEGTPPGEVGGVRANLDVRTGVREQYAAMGEAGLDLARLGHQVYRMQGEVELARLQAQDMDAIQRLYLDYQRETDPTKYQQMYEKTLGEIESREVRNGWAARRHSLYVERSKPQWQWNVGRATLARADENYKNAAALKRAHAIETGNSKDYVGFLQRSRANGLISDEEYNLEVKNLNRMVERRAIVALAGTDPDAVLKLDTWEKFHAKYPKQIPEDYNYFTGLAVAQKSRQASVLTQAQNEFKDRLYEMERSAATLKEVFNLVDNAPPELFTADQKDDLLHQLGSRWKLRRQGIDPLVTRQNQKAYKELLYLAEDGKLTRPRLRKAYDKGDITTADYQYFGKYLEGDPSVRDELYEFADVLKVTDRIIEADYFLRDVPIGELAKEKIQMRLSDRVAHARELGTPLVGKQLMLEAIRIARQEREAAQEYGMEEEAYMARPNYEDVASALAAAPVTVAPLPTPKTKAEYDALPSGTRYLHPDGKMKVKP